MSNESLASTSLPPRANVALLTLQMRAAVQEATAAEAEAEAVDVAAAQEELRARLAPLVAERRQALEAALAQARADAEVELAAARRAADVMGKQRTLRDSTRAVTTLLVDPPQEQIRDEVPTVEAEPSVESVRRDDEPVAETLSPMAAATLVAPSVPALDSDLSTSVADRTPTPSPEPGDRTDMVMPYVGAVPTANVVIDADAFARVFATVLASLLDERLGSSRPVAQPVLAPVKQSFWTHARHPDVLLMGLTMLIVLVVLAAWLV